MKQGTRKSLRKLLALVLTLTMMLSITNLAAFAIHDDDSGDMSVKASSVSDGSTADSFEKAFDGAEDVGKVWSDKTVAEMPGDPYGYEITYSALGSTNQEYKSIKRPVDLVLVIDHSGSMGNLPDGQEDEDNEPNTRMNKMVKALNATIDEFMKANEFNRVAVVMFHDTATELLPLGHYTKAADGGDYVRI